VIYAYNVRFKGDTCDPTDWQAKPKSNRPPSCYSTKGSCP
jgi:hypothetical protein